MTRIVGLDLSLTGTGVARVETGTGSNVIGMHGKPILPATVTVSRLTSKAPARKKGAPPPALPVRSLRLRKLAGQIVETCIGADLVVVEGPSYASEGAGTWDRAGLWWLVVGRLTGAGLNVVEVPPSNVKMYALGKGGGAGTGKDEVLAAVIRRYLPVVQVPGNNEADALVLAAMGARFTGAPIEPGGTIPAAHTKALDRVRWVP